MNNDGQAVNDMENSSKGQGIESSEEQDIATELNTLLNDMKELSATLAGLRKSVKDSAAALRVKQKRYDRLAGNLKKSACNNINLGPSRPPKRARRPRRRQTESDPESDISDAMETLSVNSDESML